MLGHRKLQSFHHERKIAVSVVAVAMVSCVILESVEFVLGNSQTREIFLVCVSQAGNMDTIANMLVMLKNASQRGHTSITVPQSKIKRAIAEYLVKAGYVKSVEEKKKNNHPVLEITLLYTEDGKSKIRDIERISKLSRRTYVGYRDLKPFKFGQGLYVLSTPKGIMSDTDARKEVVGGELLFSIW